MTIAILMAAWAGIATITLASAAYGQSDLGNYPSKPVTIIVPFGPGASTDHEARLYARKLGEITGGTFVVDFKPGAGSTIGTAHVARAAPDGYTLLAFTSGFTTAPALFKDLPYDPLKDFAPISLMSKRSVVLVAYASAPFRNLAEYIEHTRKHPGDVNVATAGMGSGPHLNMAWLHYLIKSKATYVHYKGSQPAMVDVTSGRVQVMATALSSALPVIKAGRLQAIAILNAERSAQLPDLATVSEQGMSEYDYSSPFGFVTRSGAAPSVIQFLNRNLAKVAASPEIVKAIEASSGKMIGTTPDDLNRLIIREINLYKKLAQSTGMKLQE